METFAYFAHQPILNRDKKLHAYELLFRNSNENVFPSVSEDDATDSLVANSLLGQSLEMLSSGAPCFVNFPEQSLIDQLPSLLSPKRVVVEVLESVQPNEQILDCLSSLRSSGYTIALDDYCHDPVWEENLDLVDIVKFDLTAQSWEELEELKNRFSRFNKVFLAEKVETHEEFQRAMDMGFDLFQGYFFSEPTIVKHRPMGANELTVMQLLEAVSSETINFDVVEELLNSDVVLSYQLLKVVNNKLGHRAGRIGSLRQAAIYLGDCELRKFVSLVSTKMINTNQPLELCGMAMARGYYCESLLKMVANTIPAGFMLGMFSLIDVILEQPIEKLLEQMPLPEPISRALAHKEGVEATVLQLCHAHERAKWNDIERLSEAIGISSDKSYRAYAQATIDSSEMMKLVS